MIGLCHEPGANVSLRTIHTCFRIQSVEVRKQTAPVAVRPPVSPPYQSMRRKARVLNPTSIRRYIVLWESLIAAVDIEINITG